MELTTKRLRIREYDKKDTAKLIENINNLEVSKNLLKVPYPYTQKDADWWMNHCKENIGRKPRENYDFAIELNSEKKVIGGIALNDVEEYQGTAEIGFWLGQNYWRQGIMTEAINAMLDFAFNKLNLRRIDWCAFIDNKASNALAKKMKFRHEGMRKKFYKSKSEGKIHDSNIYGLLKEDWNK